VAAGAAVAVLVVDGALAYRTGPRGVTLRMIGLEPRFVGYAGRGSMMHKGLPRPGRSARARLRKLAAESRVAGATR
jgi:hypothetical protein